jgi:hypothetical protein
MDQRHMVDEMLAERRLEDVKGSSCCSRPSAFCRHESRRRSDFHRRRHAAGVPSVFDLSVNDAYVEARAESKDVHGWALVPRAGGVWQETSGLDSRDLRTQECCLVLFARGSVLVPLALLLSSGVARAWTSEHPSDDIPGDMDKVLALDGGGDLVLGSCGEHTCSSTGPMVASDVRDSNIVGTEQSQSAVTCTDSGRAPWEPYVTMVLIIHADHGVQAQYEFKNVAMGLLVADGNGGFWTRSSPLVCGRSRSGHVVAKLSFVLPTPSGVLT